MNNTLVKVDHTAIKVNQITIIILSITAFILNKPWLITLIAAVMLAGTIVGKPGFLPLYSYLLKPLGWAKPHVISDNPEPHRFAQGLGGVFLLVASLSLFFGTNILGWALVWMVTGLAALNAFGGFCVGCFIYYWLSKINAPGFSKHPPAGTFPGKQPKGTQYES